MTGLPEEHVFFCGKCNELRAYVLISRTHRVCIVCGTLSIRPGMTERAIKELVAEKTNE